MKNKGWAISHIVFGKEPVLGGLYTGWWLTRREAIRAHCEAKGRSWADCRKDGDRAVKVEVREIS